MRIACPEGYEPDRRYLAHAREEEADLRLYHDARAAIDGADAVYTDVWTSMGQESEREARRAQFAEYQVNSELMELASEAMFMHCLPAHRGEEVTAEVIDGPQSVVFDEAENRLHAQKALMVLLLAARGLVTLP